MRNSFRISFRLAILLALLAPALVPAAPQSDNSEKASRDLVWEKLETALKVYGRSANAPPFETTEGWGTRLVVAGPRQISELLRGLSL